jgi:hypothetical protein
MCIRCTGGRAFTRDRMIARVRMNAITRAYSAAMMDITAATNPSCIFYPTISKSVSSRASSQGGEGGTETTLLATGETSGCGGAGGGGGWSAGLVGSRRVGVGITGSTATTGLRVDGNTVNGSSVVRDAFGQQFPMTFYGVGTAWTSWLAIQESVGASTSAAAPRFTHCL